MNICLALMCGLAMVMGFAHNAGPATTLTIADDGREVAVHARDVIRVELVTQGGTGYAWHIDKLDKGCIEHVGTTTRAPADKGMPGGPVTQLWDFKALTRGDTDLVLLYYREWEGREKAANSFRVRLRIE